MVNVRHQPECCVLAWRPIGFDHQDELHFLPCQAGKIHIHICGSLIINFIPAPEIKNRTVANLVLQLEDHLTTLITLQASDCSAEMVSSLDAVFREFALN